LGFRLFRCILAATFRNYLIKDFNPCYILHQTPEQRLFQCRKCPLKSFINQQVSTAQILFIMKKKSLQLVFAGVFCFLASLKMHAQMPEIGQLNPEFIQYLDLRDRSLWEPFTDDGKPLGYIPSPLRFITTEREPSLSIN